MKNPLTEKWGIFSKNNWLMFTNSFPGMSQIFRITLNPNTMPLHS